MRVAIDPVIVTGNDLLLVAVVPVVLAALLWFLLRTDAGIALRAIAENVDRARLLGIPVQRLSLLLWTVVGGLAALTVVLKAPSEGLTLDVIAGPADPAARARGGRRFGHGRRSRTRSAPASPSAWSTSSCDGT